MKYLVAPVAALVFSFSVNGASAEELGGTVQSLDEEEGIVVLDDGTELTVGEEFSWEGIEPGDEVTVTFDEKDDKKVITDIELTE